MPTKCFAQVRGNVIRATRLDGCGKPVVGATSVSVSKRISTITIDEVAEDGTNIRERNFGDELCVVDDGYASVIGYSTDAAFCGVDPDLISIMTGQAVVKNAAGDTVGFDADTTVDLDTFGFALEVWTKIAGAACVPGSSQRLWGYTVFPFIKGGRLGGFSFENGAINFALTGAQTRTGNQWGAGPYSVDRGGVSPFVTPGPLFTPLRTTTHYRNLLVSLDPPVATCGAVALAA